MNPRKQLIYKNNLIWTRLSLFLGLLFACLLLFFAKGTLQAHHATDCSDVYTPLSSFVVTGVSNNRSFYERAMNETGVPWEMLAAIHYRETNFSHTNPNNGQGIFQFVNGDGGPYPAGPVSDDEFYRQLKFMATKIQNDYVWRNSPNPATVGLRKLVPGEQDINLVKNTLYSYNGRATVYADQAAHFGYDKASQPYEGSPYVMNRFDCPRARMGTITVDYGGMDGIDTRYGTFTLFARLRGDNYWKLLTVPYSWNLISQEAFRDEAMTKQADLNMLAVDQKIYLRIKARNFGNTAWTNTGSNPVNLGTSNPGNRNSPFCDPTWPNCSRPATLKEATVQPGQIGTFEFAAKAPASTGTYKEYFNLLAEGKAWMNDFGMSWQFLVRPQTNQWQATGQSIYADSGMTKPLASTLSPSTSYYVRLSARNTGNTTWVNTGTNAVRLGTSSPQDRSSSFCDPTWPTCNRAATLKESTVSPGDIGTFEFRITTPSSIGTYKEYFRPVIDNVEWMNDIGAYWLWYVSQPTYEWQYVSQQVYTDPGRSVPSTNSTISNGQTQYATIRARNTGNVTWSNSGSNPVRIGTTDSKDRLSSFCDPTWPTCNRAATLKESTVSPGDIGTFEFAVKAPFSTNGHLAKERFSLVAEGKAWMNDTGLYLPFLFQSALDSWQYVGQGSYSDSARTQNVSLASTSKNSTYYLRLTAKNTSGEVWQRSTTRLGTSSPQDRSSAFYSPIWLSSNRATSLKEDSVAPGQTGTFDFQITTPSTTGSFQEYFRPLVEGKTWMVDIGLYWQIGVN